MLQGEEATGARSEETQTGSGSPEQPASRISVMLVDDHPLFREAVGRVIERCQDFQIVAEASDGEEAMALADKLSPRVTILDIGLPKTNGIEVTRRIKARNPGAAVIVLSVHDDAEHVTAMLKAGADAYLTKDVMGAEIIEALYQVAAGKMFLCSTALRHLVSSTLADRTSPASGADQGLTRRELEILGLMAHGFSNREMAERLSVSTATIKGHVEGIFSKLNVDSRTGAVTTALRLGILGLSDI